MTYKLRLHAQMNWSLQSAEGQTLPLGDLFALLDAVDQEGHIAGACKRCGVSYRHAWGLLRRAEAMLGTPLLTTSRRQGSRLTAFGRRWVQAYQTAQARFKPVGEESEKLLQQVMSTRQVVPRSQALRLHASHGFAVEGMVRAAQDHAMPALDLRYRTALEALAALRADECDLAGFQVPVGEYETEMMDDYRPWLDVEAYRLVYLAQRETGLFVQRGNPKGIRSVKDLTRAGVRFVNRQPGSSTRLLLERMLLRQGLAPQTMQGHDTSEFTHMAVAAHVASGMADAGIGVKTAAVQCGLDFIPLVHERYFFAIREAALDWPLMRDWLALLGSPAYHDYVAALPGYDARFIGKVQTLPEAFGHYFGALSGAMSRRADGVVRA